MIDWIKNLIGKAYMTSSVTMLLKGDDELKVTIKKSDGSEDKEAEVTIQPNSHDTIYLHEGRTAHLKATKKKRK